ncbi:MAG: zinc transporter ZntB [Candidatus Omnitrophica bacterium]|nr:zinc transporter ZntB [Candidatus Omnitrophota bacterium]
MTQSDGLLWGYQLDGEGGGMRFESVPVPSSNDRVIWSHWDRNHPNTKRWIREESGLDPLISEAMLVEESRPRCLATREGFFAILRGVNLNPGADPEDMVSVRLWIDPNRIITLRGPRVMAIQGIANEFDKGTGPRDVGELLAELTAALIERMGPVLDDLNDRVDDMEEQVVSSQKGELRSQLGQLRRTAITLRRYLSPQREVLSRLQTERIEWLSELNRNRIREAMDRLTRYIEDLDAIRERAAVTQEELAGILSEQMNSRMYLLSLVAGIFLPLGLLTGLLGVNVGGIPGTENEWGFVFVCGLLFVLALFAAWGLRRWKFF